MKPALAFILYNPTESVWKRISAAISEEFSVFVFDNSPSPENQNKAKEIGSSICYLKTGQNIGIGRALNYIGRSACAEGYALLLNFDQDTVFTAETLEYISRFGSACIAYMDRLRRAAVFSVTLRAGPAPHHFRPCRILEGYDFDPVKLTINSGTLFFLDRLEEVGYHNTSYFVDCVDYSMCVEAQKHGLNIFELHDIPGLDHSIEQEDKAWKLCGKTFRGRRYPNSRIRDYLNASGRLFLRSLTVSLPTSARLMRLLLEYLFLQLVVRLAGESNTQSSPKKR